MRKLTCLLLLLAICPAPLPAQDRGAQEPIPPARETYKGRRIATTMHYSGAPWLVRDSRQKEENTTKLMKVLDLKPGQVVCDMGCGNGYYTLKMARAVGERGKVYAVDIQREMLDMLMERAREAGLAERIEPVLGTVADPKLPEGELDLVLMVDVYHEFSHPVRMLRGIREALKPSGRAVLVEYRAEDPDVPIKPLHKMSKKQIMKELPPNGFELTRSFDELPWQHVMFFQPDKQAEDEEGERESQKAAPRGQ